MLIPRLQKRKLELQEEFKLKYKRSPELPFEYAALWLYGLEPQVDNDGMPRTVISLRDDPAFAHPGRYQFGAYFLSSKAKVEEIMTYYKTLGGYGEWYSRRVPTIYHVNKEDFVAAWGRIIWVRRERLSAKRFEELCQWANQVDYGTITEEEYAEQNVPQKADSVTDLAITAVSWVVQKVALVLLMALFIFVIFGGLGGILG
tara:strand:+ start:4142 stop:4747 length:606 start_codon:yes stop_codon:yes gene_type:complete